MYRIVIIELNDTAIGLAHRYEDADHAIMRDIILLRLTHLLTIPNSVNDNFLAIASSSMEEDGSLNIELATHHVRSLVERSEERRVGNGCVRTFRFRWWA